MTNTEPTEALGRRTTYGEASDPPLLSVVVPTHDVRPWIGETVQSLLDQELEELEIIVVDDHSTDGTLEFLTDIARDDSRVRIIEATEVGGAAARNTAMRLARGRYLAFCDADDLVPPTAYRALVESLESTGSDIAFGDYLKFSPTTTWRPTSGWPAYSEPRRSVAVAEHPSLIRGRAVWNKVFRREFWEGIDVEFPETPRSNDIVPMLTSYLAADRIDVIDDVVYLYRERPGASSMTARAASAGSLLAYLEQESACATLITLASDARLSSTYAGVFYEADGWKHLRDHLTEADRDTSHDDAIAQVLTTITDGLPSFRFNRLSRIRRAVFELARSGELDAASALVRVTEPHPLHRPDHVGLWNLVLDRLRMRGDQATAQEAVRMLTPLITEQIRLGSPDDDDELVVLIRSAEHASQTDPWRPLRRVPELDGSTQLDDGALLDRLRASRAAAHRITTVTVERGAVTISGLAHADTVELAFRDNATDRRFAVAVTHDSDGDGHGAAWTTATTRSTSLPTGVRLHLVAHGEDDVSTLVSFPRDVAFATPYDRLARFDVGRSGEGGMWIERRPHWTVRGAKRTYHALRAAVTKGR